jgi:hypothetical protein
MEGLLELFLLLAIAAGGWLLLKPALPTLLARVGKLRVHHALQRALPKSHYRLFRELALRPESPGKPTTPVADEVIVSAYGIFVVAAEHHSGRISGNPGEPHWTCSGWRKEHPFRNPLLRNQVRIRALRERLHLNADCFHSLVVFTGRADLAEGLPANVTPLGGMLPFVQVRTRELLGFEEADRLAGLLETERVSPGVQTAAAQLANLRRIHGSRFSARQAKLGLGLMAALLIAVGGLVQSLAEAPGQYPAPDAGLARSPFAEQAPPPRIDLPGVSRSMESAPQPFPSATRSPATNGTAPVPASARTPAREENDLAALEDRLTWEASLKCGYAAESRRCACYGPEGRKAALDYDSCKALADRISDTPLEQTLQAR